MMIPIPNNIFLCNGIEEDGQIVGESNSKIYRLNIYDAADESLIKVQLPDFVQSVHYLPNRVLDLLEIAAYVFSADRLVSRGRKDALEYHSWSRQFSFKIRVRDFNFWNSENVKNRLSKALKFMTGDRKYNFDFSSGHSTPPTSLFDREEFRIANGNNDSVDIILFSGGLDSLAGIVERLETTDRKICLVSHRSGQPSTNKTQDKLFSSLQRQYPSRLSHYKFHCGLRNSRAVEETQRSRSFLYSSIAYALSHAFSTNTIYIFENGITTFNFPKRQDMINARSSRTTHPKTLTLVSKLFSEILESDFSIETPYIWKTKTDVFEVFRKFNKESLISSSVSCGKTFQRHREATHCGVCSQCVDRRLAAYASSLDDIDDSGIYSFDFINQEISDGFSKTTLIDFIRQASDFFKSNNDLFYIKNLNELTDIVDYISGISDEDKIEKVYDVCCRHGCQVIEALKRIRHVHDDPTNSTISNSLLDILSKKEYLKDPIHRLVEDISDKLTRAIPIAFQRNKPKNENDFNDKVSSILSSEKERFEREHPVIQFALGHTVPDHSYDGYQLLIESKYIRESTSPSKASEGISADLIKYPEESYLLFIVYDPDRAISDDGKFRKQFEEKRRDLCTVCIIR